MPQNIIMRVRRRHRQNQIGEYYFMKLKRKIMSWKISVDELVHGGMVCQVE